MLIHPDYAHLLKPELPLFVDSTMIACFRSCHRKYRNEFILGLRGSGISIDLHAGGCIATALETTYNCIHLDRMSFPDALLRAEAEYQIKWGDVRPAERQGKSGPILLNAKTRERCWEAILAYFTKYPPSTDPVQPYVDWINQKSTVEFSFALPLTKETTGYDFPLHPSGEPFLYSGRADMLGIYNGKDPIVRDEKSAKALAQNWSELWDLRNQFIGYVWACRLLGIPVLGVCVRGIIILKEEIHLPEALKIGIYTDTLIDKWKYQLARDLHKIVDCWNTGYFDYNFADTCTSYGLCQFHHACRSDDEEVWLKDFSVKRWNPLLKNPAEAEELVA